MWGHSNLANSSPRSHGACKKDKPTPPSIATIDVTEISYTAAISGGNVTNEGGAPVASRGICWNTSSDPTVANSKTAESGGLGAFISSINQLTPNTKYYVRAYATNSVGTGYGNTNHWAIPNAGATNESGFTALPGGYRAVSGIFYYIGDYGRWWSYTEYDSQSGWGRGIGYDGPTVSTYGYIKQIGFSVRCIKN